LKINDYIGGLAHVHTKLSNHKGHFESDQTVARIVQTLEAAGLAGSPAAPLKYLMINEHASNPVKPHPLGKFSLRARALLRSRWHRRLLGMPILFGFEASLLPGGRTDLTPRLAENCELVIGSRHRLPEAVRENPAALMELFEQACRNPAVDVLGHPARNIERLAGMDWGKIFEVARQTGTAIEVNLNIFPTAAAEPDRYEFWSAWLELLGRSGAAVFIGSDLHNQLQLRNFIKHWRDFDDLSRPNPLRDCVAAMLEHGLTPDRVVNANYLDFQIWLKLTKTERAQ
jgi:histidinol phosphatase-like PHP family hydrolase